MSSRQALSLATLLLCLTHAAAGAVGAGGPPSSCTATQERISTIVTAISAGNRGEPVDGTAELITSLQQSLADDREALLQQVVIHRAASTGNEPSMSNALLIEFLEFTDAEKIGALIPLLASTEARLLETTRGLLATVDRPGGSAPDFRAYEPMLQKTRPETDEGLVRYLYSVSPSAALATTVRAFTASDADGATTETVRSLEQQRLITEEGEIVDSPRALAAIEALAQHDAWWVRLYAAESVRRHPQLASLATLSRLRSDSHPLVREALDR